MPPLQFDILARDTGSSARLGRVTTPHGSFDTPAFMPVGTRAAVKGLLPDQVACTGARIILANTYHLLLRPGPELIADMGGLHRWMGWPGPILTDSGGFQVFSLAHVNAISDEGVRFRSHIDGAAVNLTPELSMQVQNALGADIIMAFDDCPPASADARRLERANQRTLRWLERCVEAHGRPEEQALFGIVQGGTDLRQRSWAARRVAGFDLPGYAIGGVAVGEGHEKIREVVQHTAPLLPDDRPRYLMGVGYERDLLAAVRAGVDMFDCVLATRNARNANAFTSTGQIRLKNARFRNDPRPIEAGCDCPACAGLAGGRCGTSNDAARAAHRASPATAPSPGSPGFSRSYLRHLFMAREMLGPILVSLHNLRHFQRYLLDIRHAIAHNDWPGLARRWPIVDRPASREPGRASETL